MLELGKRPAGLYQKLAHGRHPSDAGAGVPAFARVWAPVGPIRHHQTRLAGWRTVAIIAAGRKITPGTLLRPLAALLLGMVAAVLLAEGVLRLVGLGHPHFSAPELYQVSADPRVLFEPRPSFDGYSEGTRVRTNSRGLRERELPLAPSPGTARVLFLGDSVTFGSGVLAEEAFPRLLETALDEGTEAHIR